MPKRQTEKDEGEIGRGKERDKVETRSANGSGETKGKAKMDGKGHKFPVIPAYCSFFLFCIVL